MRTRPIRSFVALVPLAMILAGTLPAQRATRLARDVTIHRDAYGVAHVIGRTDASAAFGFAYAQAEDNFWRLEENYIRALGRASEVYGEADFNSDVLNRTLDIPALARRDYARLDPRTRALTDGFAAGLNHYIARNPAAPRLLKRMEPWYPLAFIRYLYFQNGFANDRALQGTKSEIVRTAYNDSEHGEARNFGSNGFVVSASRSASGNPLLFTNPHLPFFGPGQVYEGHVLSEEGWNFTGYTRFGFPLPYVGNNLHLGWVSTDNQADLADVYEEKLDSIGQWYTYGAERRRVTSRPDSLRVLVNGKLELRRIRVRGTHHGPIVATINGRPLTLRMAKTESSGWLPEWYAMTRARTLAEFKKAMAPLDMLFGNVMYADRVGNIFYLYNGAVPRRDPQFDWTRIVNGWDPATEWKGYHTMAELPQLTNPATGWMQNCNTTPFLLTSIGNPDPAKFPSYMVREGDNARGRAARELLSPPRLFTFDEWTRLAFDTRVFTADTVLSLLFSAQPRAGTREDERAALEALRGWDRRSSVTSVPTMLYVGLREAAVRSGALGNPAALHGALRTALDTLQSQFGTWQVPWGDVNRLQRRDERSMPGFDDARPSVAIPGMNSGDGSIFTFYARPQPGQKRWYGNAGATYVSVVEFGPVVRARTIHVFGASGDPSSPHFADQAPLYARGEFKPAWLTPADVKANAVRSYRPGS